MSHNPGHALDAHNLVAAALTDMRRSFEQLTGATLLLPGAVERLRALGLTDDPLVVDRAAETQATALATLEAARMALTDPAFTEAMDAVAQLAGAPAE